MTGAKSISNLTLRCTGRHRAFACSCSFGCAAVSPVSCAVGPQGVTLSFAQKPFQNLKHMIPIYAVFYGDPGDPNILILPTFLVPILLIVLVWVVVKALRANRKRSK
jgi:hypothetical protein